MSAEMLFSARKKTSSGLIRGIRMNFLSVGRQNSGSSPGGWIGIYQLRLYDPLGAEIPLTADMLTASSIYSAAYAELYVLRPGNEYWCTANSNNGNTNRTCWFDVRLPTEYDVAKVLVSWVDGYTVQNVEIVDIDNKDLVLYHESKNSLPLYPLQIAPGMTGNTPVMEAMLAKPI
jgi:hypothetical protein